MTLADIPQHSRSRVEDLEELQAYVDRKAIMEGKSTKNAAYTTGDAFKRQESSGDEGDDPLTVFDDQKKVQEKQKQEEKATQWDDRI